MRPGIGVPRRSPRGAGVAIAFALLALALPLAAAEDPAPAPSADTAGPVAFAIVVDPEPVEPHVPDSVYVTAIAQDDQSAVADAEFSIDIPGLSPFRMHPADDVWSAVREEIYWLGWRDVFVAGRAPGPHVLFVHAQDAAGNWGPWANVPFTIVDPASVGPQVGSIGAAPVDLPRGAPLTVTANVWDPGRGAIEAAELFFDVPGADGTGQPMLAVDGLFDRPTEGVEWTNVSLLPFGDHLAYVHARARGLWGPATAVPFTARAPAFLLSAAADQTDARAGDAVTFAFSLENRGNAPATLAWLNVTLPPALGYESDTVGDAGGVRTAGTSFAFADMARGTRSFTLVARVAAGVQDGAPLDLAAMLDYTNEVGWDFAEVPAGTAGTAIAPELAVSITGPASASAGESVVLRVRLTHSGTRTIPSVDLVLGDSVWTALVADATGGTVLEPGSWRLADVARGVHDLEVTERVSRNALDGVQVPRPVRVAYLARDGVLETATATHVLGIARPLLAVSVRAEPATVAIGERVAFTIRYTNDGSAAAASVVVRATLPEGLAWIGGDAPRSAVGGAFEWERVAVGPGSGEIVLVAEARAAGAANLLVRLEYTGPGGAAVGDASAIAGVVVFAPTPIASLTVSTGFLAAAALSAAAMATERGKVAFLFFAVPLYTRLRHERILDHETRGMIRGYIVANPGDHYNSIKEALELPNGTLAYHLQVLHKEKLVRSVKDGKFRRFYPFEMRLPVGGQPTKIQRVILELIRANPGVTPRDLAGLLGITSSTVSYHLEKLDELGRIEFRREGITKRLHVREQRS